jgi:hypothetical protein
MQERQAGRWAAGRQEGHAGEAGRQVSSRQAGRQQAQRRQVRGHAVVEHHHAAGLDRC